MAGTVFKYGSNVDTDVILPARYLALYKDEDLAAHCMEDLDSGFVTGVQPGDYIVAGENFGCGSSRETAPIVIKEAGIAAVVAKSFARIFYRNCINIGLPVVTCDTDGIEEGQMLTVDLENGFVQIEGSDKKTTIAPYPDQVKELMEAGGMLEWLRAAGKIK